jgi:hypothetical protein
MLRLITVITLVLLPLMACAQSRLAPGEAGSTPRMGEEPVAEPIEPQSLSIAPPPVLTPVAPQAPSPATPPVATTQPPAVSSPPMTGVPQPVMPDMTPNCMRPAELIGKPQSAMGTVQFTNPTRILSPGSAATMDYSPNRTNIILDAQGIIREMTCG